MFTTGSMSIDILPVLHYTPMNIFRISETHQEQITKKKKKFIFTLSSNEIRYTEINGVSNILISLRSEKKTYSVKKWCIFIFQEKNREKKTIKSFSGGNVLPSTISWIGRNYTDEISPPGVYYIQAIIIDGSSNTITFSPEKIVIYP